MLCFGVDFLLWSCISPPSTSSSPWDPFPFISFQPLHTTALLVCMSTRSANREELIGPCSWPNSQWEQSVLGLSFQDHRNWGCQGCTCTPYSSRQLIKNLLNCYQFAWLLSIMHPLILAACYVPVFRQVLQLFQGESGKCSIPLTFTI